MAMFAGLGLYVVQESVKAQGGMMDVISLPEEGTTFTIRLPLIAVEETSPI
jgi:phosphoserine phosphatase RsbU/P